MKHNARNWIKIQVKGVHKNTFKWSTHLWRVEKVVFGVPMAETKEEP